MSRKSGKSGIAFIIFLLAALGIVAFFIIKNYTFNNPLSQYSQSPAQYEATPAPDSSTPVPQTPGPIPTAKPADKIQAMIDNMDINEKIGQMVIAGYDDINDMLPVVSDYKLGGIILYKKNIISVDQTVNDINTLKDSNKNSKVPLFFSIDQEGGRITRLPEEIGTFEAALTIGNKNNEKYAFDSGVKLAKAIKQLGFNLDFAPVMDIFSNPENTVIADRAYGTTPDRVSKIGVQVLSGILSEDIIAVVKHFPGHGDTAVDSHYGLPVVNKTLAELTDFEFKPFVAAINNNVDMIMIAHIILSKIDDVPSTMSKNVVTDILRSKLGFGGVVISDDMIMGAITENYTLTAAAVTAVNAGCDMLIISKQPQDAVSVIKALKAAVEAGELTEERIDKSVYRILKLKYKYGIAG